MLYMDDDLTAHRLPIATKQFRKSPKYVFHLVCLSVAEIATKVSVLKRLFKYAYDAHPSNLLDRIGNNFDELKNQ